MISSSSISSTDEETKIARIESQLKTTIAEVNDELSGVKQVESTDDQPPSLTSPTSMIVSQSNHYNYSTRSNVAKQQQQQSITINNFNSSTNMTYNFGQPSYPYPYPPAPPMDIQPFYYPSPMNYMPYYPTSSSTPVYPPGQQMCYQPNGVNPIPYNGNSTTTTTTPYGYSTPQSSSSRRH
jgi:hypothetical protein